MKTSTLLIIGILMHIPVFSQNILEALALKNERFGAYVAGELQATDTTIDLKNGYYEEFYSSEGGEKHTVRQAAIFHNDDGSRTLGISITEYDFVCVSHTSHFYEISRSKDHMHKIQHEDIVPMLHIREFVTDTIISVLQKYLPILRGNYLAPDATMDKLLSEVYHIMYKLPQSGTNITATLGLCDYIPRNEVNIHPGDWSIIQNDFGSMELAYDKSHKKFTKAPAKNK